MRTSKLIKNTNLSIISSSHILKCANKSTIIMILLMILCAITNEMAYARQVQEAADPTQSIVTGTGVASFEAFTNVVVTVQARFANGTDKTTGGDTFIVVLQNQCQVTNQFYCEDVTAQQIILDSELHEVMTDNGDGTYEYSYTVSIDGTITVSVYMLTQSGVYAEYFGNNNYSGPPDLDQIESNIDFNWFLLSVGGVGLDLVSARYYFYLKGPITGTVNFGITADDEATLFLAGEQLLYSGVLDSNSQTMEIEQDQFYPFRIDYVEDLINASLDLKWNYTGQSEVVIPTNEFYYPEYVGSAPIDVVVSCPNGYTGYPTFTDSCTTVCGDGIKAGTEKCDDGNLANNDGCSNNCQIEDDFVCKTKNSGASSCNLCELGYTPNSASSECVIIEEIPSSIEVFSSTALGAVAVGATFSLASSAMGNSSFQNIFSLINFVQILLLLPLIGAYMPIEIVYLCLGFLDSLFNVDFIQLNKTPGIKNFVSKISHKQPNGYMYLMELEDGSAFVNVFNLIGLLIFIPLAHIIIFIIYKKTSKMSDKRKIRKFIIKVYEYMTYNVYIQIFFELYLLLCINVISELYKTDFTTDSTILSYSFCVIMFLFLLSLLILAIWQWVKSRDDIEFIKLKYFTEFFNGIKEKYYARSFCIMFLLRRFLCVASVISLVSLSMYTRIITFCTIQTSYFVFLCVARPFDKFKANLSEILNEAMYTLLCLFLLYFNSKEKWTECMISIYIWCIMSIIFITMLISIVFTIKDVVRYCKKRNKMRKLRPYRVEVKKIIDFSKESQVFASKNIDDISLSRGNSINSARDSDYTRQVSGNRPPMSTFSRCKSPDVSLSIKFQRRRPSNVQYKYSNISLDALERSNFRNDQPTCGISPIIKKRPKSKFAKSKMVEESSFDMSKSLNMCERLNNSD